MRRIALAMLLLSTPAVGQVSNPYIGGVSDPLPEDLARQKRIEGMEVGVAVPVPRQNMPDGIGVGVGVQRPMPVCQPIGVTEQGERVFPLGCREVKR
jgi:hypothetical protein